MCCIVIQYRLFLFSSIILLSLATIQCADEPPEVIAEGLEFADFNNLEEWKNCESCECDPLTNKNLSPVKIDGNKAIVETFNETLKIYSNLSPPKNLYHVHYFLREDKNSPYIDALSITIDDNEERLHEGTYITGIGNGEGKMYFNFAWILFGNPNTKFSPERSLHQINNKTFPMEIVMSFYECETCRSMGEPSPITQVHVMVQLTDEDNSVFNPIVNNIQMMKNSYLGKSQTFEYARVHILLAHRKEQLADMLEGKKPRKLLRQEASNMFGKSARTFKEVITRKTIGAKKKRKLSDKPKTSPVKKLEAEIAKLEKESKKLKAPTGQFTIKAGFQISLLFPPNGGYYSYNGSGPLPPCHPRSRVIVMKNPIDISKKQFNKLVKGFGVPKVIINDVQHDPLDITIPPIRQLGERQVYHNQNNIQHVKAKSRQKKK